MSSYGKDDPGLDAAETQLERFLELEKLRKQPELENQEKKAQKGNLGTKKSIFKRFLWNSLFVLVFICIYSIFNNDTYCKDGVGYPKGVIGVKCQCSPGFEVIPSKKGGFVCIQYDSKQTRACANCVSACDSIKFSVCKSGVGAYCATKYLKGNMLASFGKSVACNTIISQVCNSIHKGFVSCYDICADPKFDRCKKRKGYETFCNDIQRNLTQSNLVRKYKKKNINYEEYKYSKGWFSSKKTYKILKESGSSNHGASYSAGLSIGGEKVCKWLDFDSNGTKLKSIIYSRGKTNITISTFYDNMGDVRKKVIKDEDRSDTQINTMTIYYYPSGHKRYLKKEVLEKFDWYSDERKISFILYLKNGKKISGKVINKDDSNIIKYKGTKHLKSKHCYETDLIDFIVLYLHNILKKNVKLMTHLVSKGNVFKSCTFFSPKRKVKLRTCIYSNIPKWYLYSPEIDSKYIYRCCFHYSPRTLTPINFTCKEKLLFDVTP